jgi:hypothetical protein
VRVEPMLRGWEDGKVDDQEAVEGGKVEEAMHGSRLLPPHLHNLLLHLSEKVPFFLMLLALYFLC